LHLFQLPDAHIISPAHGDTNTLCQPHSFSHSTKKKLISSSSPTVFVLPHYCSAAPLPPISRSASSTVQLLYLKYSNCESKVESVTRRAWTSSGFVQTHSENREKRTGSHKIRKDRRGVVMLFLSIRSNLGRCPATPPQTRPHEVPAPAVSHSPSRAPGRCRTEAEGPPGGRWEPRELWRQRRGRCSLRPKGSRATGKRGMARYLTSSAKVLPPSSSRQGSQ